MGNNLPERLRRDISVFAKKHGVRQVILFGSRARGDHTPRSDIDLAVKGGDFDAFWWDVRENAHTLLTFDMVDLGADVSEELKKEIEKDGVTVYEEA